MPFTRRQWERWKREHPEEWKARAEKIAASHKGRRLSAEHRASIARSMRGRKLPARHREKIAESVRRAHIGKSHHRPRFELFKRISHIGFERRHAFFTVCAVAIVLIVAFGLTNLGYFVQENWVKHWEAMKEITVDNNIDYVTTHVAFGAYRSSVCAEGIHITDGTQEITFEVLNQAYDENMLCAEADVRFRNVIYAPTGLEVAFVEPTPQDGVTINENMFVVKVSTTEGTNFTLLEWGKDNITNTASMNGYGTEWSYNLTDLENGTYRYRVLATNITGGMAETGYRAVTINVVNMLQPIENITQNITENITQNVSQNITLNITENVTENATENVTENITTNVTQETPHETVEVPEAPVDNQTEEANETLPTGSVVAPLRITYYIYYGKKPAEELNKISFVEPTPDDGKDVSESWILINATTNADTQFAVIEWSHGNEDPTTAVMAGSGTNFWYNLTDLERGTYRFRVIATGAGNMTVSSETRTFITVDAVKEYDVQIRQGVAKPGKPVKWSGYVKFKNTHKLPKVLGLKGVKWAPPVEATNISIIDVASNKNETLDELKNGIELPPGGNVTYDISYETPPPQQTEGVPDVTEKLWTKRITIGSNATVEYTNIAASTDVREVRPENLKLYRWVGNGRIDITNDPAFAVQKMDNNANGLTDELQWVVPHLSNQTFEVEADISILNVQSYPVVGGNWTVMFKTTGVADLSIRAVNGTTWSNVNENGDLKFLEVRCGDNILDYSWLEESGSVYIANYSCSETGYETSKVLTTGVHTLEFVFGNDTEYANNMAQGTPFLQATSIYNLTTDNITCYNQSSVGANTNIYNFYRSGTPFAALVLPFDLNNSTGVKDYSGFSNPAFEGIVILSNWTAGKIGGAYNFSDINTYIEVSDVSTPSDPLNFTNAFTAEAWIYWAGNSTVGNQSITSKWMQHRWGVEDKGPIGGALYAIPNENMSLYFNTSANTIAMRTWTHVAYTYDGSTQRLYVNGTLKASSPAVFTFGTSLNPLRIGRASATPPGTYFNGTIDEVRLYGRALSAAQISQRYKETKDNNTDKFGNQYPYTNNQTIVSNELNPGEVWTCEITPNNVTKDELPTTSNPVTILAAYQSTPLLTSTSGLNMTTDNITCSNQTWGSNTCIYNWYKNDLSITVLNLPMDTQYSGGINTTRDYSGYNNSGMLGNKTLSDGYEPAWTSTGVIGGAYNFTGPDVEGHYDYIQMEDSATLDISTNLTIEAWIYRTFNSTADVTLIEKADSASPAPNYNIRLGSARVSFGYYTGGTWHIYRTAQAVLPVNIWTHIAVKYKSGDASSAAIFINGVKQTDASWVAGTGAAALTVNANPLYISGGAGALVGFNGTIDEVRIYNGVMLSGDQIMQRYVETKDGLSSRQTIVSAQTKAGDVWTCQVLPNNGRYDGDGAPLNSTDLTILSAYQGTPLLNATSIYNLTTDNITCYNQSSVGANTNIFNWYKNGSAIMLLNMPFDSDDSGGVNMTKDYSGNGYTGQLGSTADGDAAEPTWTANGKVGGAYLFNGSKSQYITTTDIPYFNGANTKLTVAFWINDTQLSNGQVIVGKYNGATVPLHRTFLVQMHTNGILRGVAYQDGDAQNYVFFDTNSIEVTQNKWSHVAVVFDLSAQNIDIYVNGTEVASTKTTNLVPPTVFSDTTIPVEIGRATNPNSWLNGTLDDVRIYGSALSAAQIERLYSDTKGGYSSNQTIVSNEIRDRDVWSCQITPNDAEEDGTPLNSSNLSMWAMFQLNPILTSTGYNRSVDNITCYNLSSQNVNTNIYNWYKNNVSIMGLNVPFDSNDSYAIGRTKDYSSNDTDKGRQCWEGTPTVGDSAEPKWTTTGKVGGAYIFDGVDDYLNCTNDSATESVTNLTVEAWIRPNYTLGGYHTIMERNQNWLFMLTDERVQLHLVDSGSAYHDVWNSTTKLSKDTWYHVVATVANDDVSTRAKIYINGTEGTVNVRYDGGWWDTGVNGTMIGRRAIYFPGPIQQFNGTIDEVRVYRNLTMNPAQVEQRYLETKDGYSSNQTMVSANLKVDDKWICSITPNDGTLNGVQLNSSRMLILYGEPIHDVPVLNSTTGFNLTTDNITCYNQSTLSPLNKAVTNIYTWNINSTPYASLVMPFDLNNIVTAKDYSGNGLNGQVIGLTWNASGKIGGGYEFNGGNVFIEITDTTNSPLDVVSNLTMEAWIYFKGNTTGNYNNESITSKWNQHRWGVELAPTEGKLYFIGNESGETYFATSQVVIPRNKWVHVAYTYDGYTERLYVNGTEMATKTFTFNFTQNDNNFRIGRASATPPGTGFNGTIDEFRFYSRTLSATQIRQRYQDTVDGYVVNATIVSDETQFDDVFTCSVTPNDATYDGITKSNTLTINNGLYYTNGSFGVTGGTYTMDYILSSGGNFSGSPYKAFIVTGCIVNSSRGGTYEAQLGCMYPIGLGHGEVDVHYVSPTPAGGARTTDSSVTINATVDSTEYTIDTCILEWNGANETMTKVGDGTSVYCYKAKTLTDGPNTFKVYANDSDGNWGAELQSALEKTVPPSFEGVLVEDDVSFPYNQLDLAAGQTKHAVCNATVNDVNGPSNFNSAPATALFYYPQGVLSLTNASGIWHFEEGSGQTASDSTYNGNTASLGNTSASEVTDPVWTASGRFGNALILDGDDDFVNASNASSLNIVGNLTIEAWIKTANTDMSQGILDKTGAGDATNKGYLMWLGVGRPRFRIVQSGALTSIAGTTNISNNPGAWYHVAATYNTASGMKIYVNGVLEDSNNTVSGAIDSTTGDLLIGKLGAGAAAYYLNGTIDEVAVYNYTKSASDILIDSHPEGCTGDNNWCYTNNSCDWLAVKNSTAQYVECGFDMWFNAVNTSNSSWICNLTVADSDGMSGAGNDTTDINTLLAVGTTPSTLPFGVMKVGDTSANDLNTTMQNYGNVRIDMQLNGTNMACIGGGGGTIAVSSLHYNCTDYGQAYTAMTALTGTPSDSAAACSGFNLQKNITATTQSPLVPTQDLPWKIKIPLGVGGNCSSIIWFTAVFG